jgi:nucleotide-binding universal stress UspA family protein
MRMVAGFIRSPEGLAALQRAIEEAQLRSAELLVVHSAKGEGPLYERDDVVEYREEFERIESQLSEMGVKHRRIELARGNSPSEDLLQVAKDEDVDLIVLGIRRRSPVGKMVLGSNAQDVLLKADCAVLAVKPPAAAK